MELRQLKYFIAAAEELHFQRAARRLNLTQPALSHQIKIMEEELGVVLLARSRKSVALTKAGEVFLKSAKEVVDSVDAAIAATRKAGGFENPVLKVGTHNFLNLDIIARCIMNTRRAGVKIEVIEMPTSEVFQSVKEGQTDIAFGPPPIDHPALITKTIVQGNWSIVLPRDHALAKLEAIPVEALSDQPIIIFNRALNPKVYDWCIEQFKHNGIAPNIVYETNQIQTALRMVGNGSALYWVASYIVEDAISDGLVIKPLSGFPSDIKNYAAWHESNQSKSLKIFLNCLRELMRS